MGRRLHCARLAEGFDLGGAKLVYGKDDNQGMDEVFLTVIQADGSLLAGLSREDLELLLS